jgi:hypothetical protein
VSPGPAPLERAADVQEVERDEEADERDDPDVTGHPAPAARGLRHGQGRGEDRRERDHVLERAAPGNVERLERGQRGEERDHRRDRGVGERQERDDHEAEDGERDEQRHREHVPEARRGAQGEQHHEGAEREETEIGARNPEPRNP